jgi:HEAT repeats
MKSCRKIFSVVAGSVMTATTFAMVATGAFAQEKGADMPRVQNARVEQRTLTAPLAAEVGQWAAQSDEARWMGYAVPEVAGDREVCCNGRGDTWGRGDCDVCRLEREDTGVNLKSRGENDNGAGSATGTVKLEGSHNLVVLLRAESKRVISIRVLSEECGIDAGGLRLVWLTGVKPEESVAMLRGFVHNEDFADRDRGRDGRRVSDAALTAIALHADQSADLALVSFVQPEQNEELRKHASFWLGEARGNAGFAVLQKMAKNDPNADVRGHVTFALSVSREPAALDEMIRMAKDDDSAHVRGQALFWLAQKAGKKAVGTITGAIENDPNTEVKKKAVFALSQLPKQEGVPKLIEVAQTNRNPAVRKQAMFWLGQSNDPRALAFFEKVLAH